MENYYAVLEQDNTFNGIFEVGPKEITKYHRKVVDVGLTNDYDKELYQRFGPEFEWDKDFLYRIFKIEPVPAAKEILLNKLLTAFTACTSSSTLENYTGLPYKQNAYILEEAKQAIDIAINENRLIETQEFPMLDLLVDNFHNPYLKTNKIHSVLEAAQMIVRMEKEDKKKFVTLYSRYVSYRKTIIKSHVSIGEKLIKGLNFT